LQAQANRGRAQAARAQIPAAPRGRSLAQMFPWAPKRRRSTLPPWRSAKICLGPTLPYRLFSTSITAISSRIACVADDNASRRIPPAVDFKNHTRFTAKVLLPQNDVSSCHPNLSGDFQPIQTFTIFVRVCSSRDPRIRSAGDGAAACWIRYFGEQGSRTI
jgi:hypothetical protein